jgi:ubiquinone/menaquinone biosynthesis C-methylase UbiE
VTENDVIIDAFTDLAPRYEQVVDGELRRFWGWSYEAFVERLLALAPVSAGDVVLDVATGTAVIPRKLSTRVEPTGRIVGLDITLAMLRHGQKAIQSGGSSSNINLTCASAMAMPYLEGTFDVVICALATHHMVVRQMLSEMRRVLKAGGHLAVADVAAAPSWRRPGIKTLLRAATFLYFLPGQGIARAWAESDAVSHVHTADEWRVILAESGFLETDVIQLASNHSWSPAPLVIKATKS